MSVMFQLFSAEDLKDLEDDQITDLVEKIKEKLQASQDPFLKQTPEHTTLMNSVHQAFLVARTFQAEPGAYQAYQKKITDTLRERAHDVFRQLKSRLPSNPRTDLLDLTEEVWIQVVSSTQENEIRDELYRQLLSPQDRDSLDPKEKRILYLAISCELANFNSYDALRVVRDDVYPQMRGHLQDRRLKDPDSRYSPFNPDHPLYESEY